MFGNTPASRRASRRHRSVYFPPRFHEGATFFELTAFAEAACAGAAPPVSVRDGMMAVAMGTAAHKSLAEKRVVAISEVLPGYSV